MSNGNGVSTLVDAYDMSIIAALAEDSDITAKALSSKVHLSRTAIVRRITQLRDRGIVGVPKSSVDFDKLGFKIRAIVDIIAPSKGSFDLLDSLLLRPETLSVSVVAGKGIMVVDAIFRDIEHLHRFLSDFPGATDSETRIVLRRHESAMQIRDRICLVDQFLSTPDDRFS